MKTSHLGNLGRAIEQCLSNIQLPEDCDFDLDPVYVKCRSFECSPEMQVHIHTRQSRLVRTARNCWDREIMAYVCVFHWVGHGAITDGHGDELYVSEFDEKVEQGEWLSERLDQEICDKGSLTDESGNRWKLLRINEEEDVETFDEEALQQCDYVSERMYRFRCPFKKSRATNHESIK